MHILLILFAWPYGIVVGNLIASAITTGLALAYAMRKLNCSVRRCPRISFHSVQGTTYRTCHHHATVTHHATLVARHVAERPDQHELLNSRE